MPCASELKLGIRLLPCARKSACSPVPVVVRVIVGALFALCVGLTGWLLLADDPPPDELNLRVTPSKRASGENPLMEYQRSLRKFDANELQMVHEAGWELGQAEPDAENTERLVGKFDGLMEAFWKLEATDPATWKWESAPTEPIAWWIDDGFVITGQLTFPLRMALLQARAVGEAGSFWLKWARVQRVSWEMAEADPNLWEFIDVADQAALMLASLPVWLTAHPAGPSELPLIQETLEDTLPESHRAALFFRQALPGSANAWRKTESLGAVRERIRC